MSATEERAWLLEKEIGGQPNWIGVIDFMLRWTPDANKALRLARREDADKLAEICEDADRCTEHIWTAPTEEQCPQCYQRCSHGYCACQDRDCRECARKEQLEQNAADEVAYQKNVIGPMFGFGEPTTCPRCGATRKELQCCDYPPHPWHGTVTELQHERDEAIKQRHKYIEMVGRIRESIGVAKQTIDGWARDSDGRVTVNPDVISKAVNAAIAGLEGK